jgi:hypothetical protein
VPHMYCRCLAKRCKGWTRKAGKHNALKDPTAPILASIQHPWHILVYHDFKQNAVNTPGPFFGQRIGHILRTCAFLSIPTTCDVEPFGFATAPLTAAPRRPDGAARRRHRTSCPYTQVAAVAGCESAPTTTHVAIANTPTEPAQECLIGSATVGPCRWCWRCLPA